VSEHAREAFVAALEADKHIRPQFRKILAQLLWEEGKFPGGGARTSISTCQRIVDCAIVRFVNQTKEMVDA